MVSLLNPSSWNPIRCWGGEAVEPDPAPVIMAVLPDTLKDDRVFLGFSDIVP